MRNRPFLHSVKPSRVKFILFFSLPQDSGTKTALTSLENYFIEIGRVIFKICARRGVRFRGAWRSINLNSFGLCYIYCRLIVQQQKERKYILPWVVFRQ